MMLYESIVDDAHPPNFHTSGLHLTNPAVYSMLPHMMVWTQMHVQLIMPSQQVAQIIDV